MDRKKLKDKPGKELKNNKEMERTNRVKIRDS